MLRSVASKVMRAGRAKVLLLGLAMMGAVLAANLLVLTVATKPAEAAYPGSNGAIIFGDGSQVYRMNSDGFGQTRLSDAAGTNFQPDRFANRKEIAFSNISLGNAEVYWMDSYGTDEINLTKNYLA